MTMTVIEATGETIFVASIILCIISFINTKRGSAKCGKVLFVLGTTLMAMGAVILCFGPALIFQKMNGNKAPAEVWHTVALIFGSTGIMAIVKFIWETSDHYRTKKDVRKIK